MRLYPVFRAVLVGFLCGSMTALSGCHRHIAIAPHQSAGKQVRLELRDPVIAYGRDRSGAPAYEERRVISGRALRVNADSIYVETNRSEPPVAIALGNVTNLEQRQADRGASVLLVLVSLVVIGAVVVGVFAATYRCEAYCQN